MRSIELSMKKFFSLGTNASYLKEQQNKNGPFKDRVNLRNMKTAGLVESVHEN